MTQPSSSARAGADARWVSETTDERVAGVRRVDVVLRAGRIEIGRRPRDARLRTTVAVTGWRARLARLGRLWEPTGVTVQRTDDVLHVSGGSGQVRVRLDVTDDAAVTARIATGDITLWGVGADLDLHVGSGTLAGRELTGTVVTAANEEGEVNLHFAAPPRRLEATARGAVVVVLPAGRYAVDAACDAASDAAAAAGVDDESSGAEVTVEQAAGPATVVVRGTTRAAVLAATGSEPI